MLANGPGSVKRELVLPDEHLLRAMHRRIDVAGGAAYGIALERVL
jgi:hypothetical protein